MEIDQRIADWRDSLQREKDESAKSLAQEDGRRRKNEFALFVVCLIAALYTYPVTNLESAQQSIKIPAISLELPLGDAIAVFPTLIAVAFLVFLSSAIRQESLNRTNVRAEVYLRIFDHTGLTLGTDLSSQVLRAEERRQEEELRHLKERIREASKTIAVLQEQIAGGVDINRERIHQLEDQLSDHEREKRQLEIEMAGKDAILTDLNVRVNDRDDPLKARAVEEINSGLTGSYKYVLLPSALHYGFKAVSDPALTIARAFVGFVFCIVPFGSVGFITWKSWSLTEGWLMLSWNLLCLLVMMLVWSSALTNALRYEPQYTG